MVEHDFDESPGGYLLMHVAYSEWLIVPECIAREMHDWPCFAAGSREAMFVAKRLANTPVSPEVEEQVKTLTKCGERKNDEI
jgi:hypothetical protein